MQVIIKDKSKNIKIKDVKKLSEFGKAIGLMFRSRENCPAMLFEFSKPTRMRIHSFFVFFKFGAVWLDDKNKIIENKNLIKFFKFCFFIFHLKPPKAYRSLFYFIWFISFH